MTYTTRIFWLLVSGKDTLTNLLLSTAVSSWRISYGTNKSCLPHRDEPKCIARQDKWRGSTSCDSSVGCAHALFFTCFEAFVYLFLFCPRNIFCDMILFIVQFECKITTNPQNAEILLKKIGQKEDSTFQRIPSPPPHPLSSPSSSLGKYCKLHYITFYI